jgi:hypothetical protein
LPGGDRPDYRRTVFEAYVEKVFAPNLPAAPTDCGDGQPQRKGPRVREFVQERSCELLCLPPYSPDLDPIVRRLLPGSRA